MEVVGLAELGHRLACLVAGNELVDLAGGQAFRWHPRGRSTGARLRRAPITARELLGEGENRSEVEQRSEDVEREASRSMTRTFLFRMRSLGVHQIKKICACRRSF